jgi:transcriptional regulator with XRE-family HTH domain
MSDTLGDFLRARREQIAPGEVGLPGSERRRVVGLRREEVAMLAGISTEYYLRLEQGRDLHPSDQVLDALASALQLDGDAIGYLHRLAHPVPAAKRRRSRTPAAPSSLQPLLDAWTTTPAHASGANGKVVAANRLAVALTPNFAVGGNPLRAAFLDPEMRRLYPDWEDLTAKTVSGLRAMIGVESADPELLATIGELSVASERFRTLWARRDIRTKTTGLTRMEHPVVGELLLHYEKMLLPEARQLLVVYRADPGSSSAERLQMLASL